MKIRNTSKHSIDVAGENIAPGGSAEISRGDLQGDARKVFDGMVKNGDLGLGDAPTAQEMSSEAEEALRTATAEANEAKAKAEELQAEAQKIIDGAKEAPKGAKKKGGE